MNIQDFNYDAAQIVAQAIFDAMPQHVSQATELTDDNIDINASLWYAITNAHFTVNPVMMQQGIYDDKLVAIQTPSYIYDFNGNFYFDYVGSLVHPLKVGPDGSILQMNHLKTATVKQILQLDSQYSKKIQKQFTSGDFSLLCDHTSGFPVFITHNNNVLAPVDSGGGSWEENFVVNYKFGTNTAMYHNLEGTHSIYVNDVHKKSW